MAEPVGYPTEECRSCHAVTRWASERGNKVLLDVPALPVQASKPLDERNGDVLLEERPGFLPVATRVKNAQQLFGKTEVWRRHIVSCPDRRYWAGRAQQRARRLPGRSWQ